MSAPRTEHLAEGVTLDLQQGRVVLNVHVAGLAQTNEIAQIVCLMGGCELPERLSVVNCNLAADHPQTQLAGSSISIDSDRPRFKPPLAPIGSYSAHIVRSVTARLFSLLPCSVAGFGTEPATRLALVLSDDPRNVAEAAFASITYALDVLHTVPRGDLLGRESIRRPDAFSPSVSGFVGIWHFAVAHMPLATTGKTAKSCGGGPVRLDLKRRGTDFASFFNHNSSVPRSTGVAKLQVAAS